MVTRIEELAIIITERREPYVKLPRGDDKEDKYKDILRHAQDILSACQDYRAHHP